MSNTEELNESFESKNGEQKSIADSNDGQPIELPIFNPLSLQILPSAANPSPSVQFTPVTPGQFFVMFVDCISGCQKMLGNSLLTPTIYIDHAATIYGQILNIKFHGS